MSSNEADLQRAATTEDQVILLGPRASYQCARAIHNDFDPTVAQPRVVAPVSADAKVLLDKASDFRQHVHQALLETFPPDSLLDLSEIGTDAAVIATKSAMSRRVPLIYRGVLPPDVDGARSGRPDLLALDPSAPEHDPRYLPILIKAHHMVEGRKKVRTTSSLRYVPIDRLSPLEITDTAGSLRKKTADILELAHFRRMLEACGRASSEAIGGLIGTAPIDDELVAVIISLDAPLLHSARTSATLSPLEHYDAKFQFRRDVADHALGHDRLDRDFLPLAVATGSSECESCRWEPTCQQVVGSRDASFTLGKLGFDEWNALRDLQCQTVDDLAQLDLTTVQTWTPDSPDENDTAHLLRAYLAEVGYVARAQENLAKTVARAQMFIAGQQFKRLGDEPIDVPRASVEVDLDMESVPDGVYLWGLLISRPDLDPQYQAIASWTQPTPATEAELAAELWELLTGLARVAADHDDKLLVYHYTGIEAAKFRQAVTASDDPRLPTLPELNDFIDEHFVDLHGIVKRNYVGFDGLGLKQVAAAAGFRWRFDGAGGLQSTDWLSEFQRTGSEELRSRILEYNEDDVRATLVVRERINQIATEAT